MWRSGVKYFDSCPIRVKVPVYLVILGIAVTLRLVCVFVQNRSYFSGGDESEEVRERLEAVLKKWSPALDALQLVVLVLGGCAFLFLYHDTGRTAKTQALSANFTMTWGELQRRKHSLLTLL